MVPSNKWFRSSLQDRAAWYQNFVTQLAVLGASLGFTPAEIAAFQDDNTVMQFLAQTDVDLGAFDSAVRQYRKTITEGSIGDPTPIFPANPAFALPEVIPTGMFERLVDAVDRIRVAPAYTPEAGAQLDIIPASNGPSPESELKPVLKPTTLPGNVIEVRFTRRQTDGIEVDTKIDLDADWSSAGRFFRSPAVLLIPNGTGLPHAVQVRARFLDGNSPVGQNSDTVNVVTTP